MTAGERRGGVFAEVQIKKRRPKMEELKDALVAKIGEQLKAEKINIQLLDVLNRLLGTVLYSPNK